MLNSILLCGSSYNKYKKVSFVLFAIMILRLLYIQTNQVIDLFTITNVIILAGVPLLINRVKNENVKKVLSILSILIWSVMIDIISFYMLPQLAGGATLFTYILRGIAFNSKYLISNIMFIVVIEVINKVYNKMNSISLKNTIENITNI
jgi:hypothetical protein